MKLLILFIVSASASDVLYVEQPHDFTIGFNLFAALNSVHTLNISNLTIETVENGALCTSPFTKIIIENNQKFPNLSRAFFYNDCPSLNSLKISGNSDMEIESNAFYGLNNLIEIEINNQKIEHITTEFFKHLVNLEMLIIKFSQVEAIDQDAFNDLVELRSLHLEGNRLGGIDGLLTEMTHLEEIIILEKLYHFPWSILKHFIDLRSLMVTTDVSDFTRGIISNIFPELKSSNVDVDENCDDFLVTVKLVGWIQSPQRNVTIQGFCFTSSSTKLMFFGRYNSLLAIIILLALI